MGRRAYYRKASDFERQDARLPSVDPRHYGADCDNCPLNGQKPVWGDGNRSRVLALVGEAPGRDEEAAGMPFVGKSGQYLETVLELNGERRSNVWLDNAVMCFPPGGDMKAFLQQARKEAESAGRAFKSPIDCCRPRLFRVLGIPRCATCGKWDGREVVPALACACQGAQRRLIRVQDRSPPRVVVALGNSALESLTGHGGIKEKQLYRFEGNRNER